MPSSNKTTEQLITEAILSEEKVKYIWEIKCSPYGENPYEMKVRRFIYHHSTRDTWIAKSELSNFHIAIPKVEGLHKNDHSAYTMDESMVEEYKRQLADDLIRGQEIVVEFQKERGNKTGYEKAKQQYIEMREKLDEYR